MQNQVATDPQFGREKFNLIAADGFEMVFLSCRGTDPGFCFVCDRTRYTVAAIKFIDIGFFLFLFAGNQYQYQKADNKEFFLKHGFAVI